MTSQQYKQMRYENLISILPGESVKIKKLIEVEDKMRFALGTKDYIKYYDEHILLLDELRSIRGDIFHS